MMRYDELYRYGARQLKQADIAEAELDARLLLEFVCHTDRNTLLAHGDMEVTPEQEKDYVNHIAKRAEHIPLQHLTGEQEFMGLSFAVNEHVLIPRQDTEILVEEAMRHLHDGMEILDMCTGSGCILLSLLHYSNRCTGVGVDISEEALAVARQNAERMLGRKITEPGTAPGEGATEGSAEYGNATSDSMTGADGNVTNVSFMHSDLFEKLDQNRKFDLLVSNPPYIPTQVIGTLMPEVREHEPVSALDGRDDGLYYYRRISKEAKGYLYRGAHVLFEIGCDQGAAVSDILRSEGYREIEVIQDFAGLDRVASAVFVEE